MYTHLPIHMTITEFRKDIAKAAERVTTDRTILIVTRGNKEPLAVLPYSDLSSYVETDYLMNHPGYGRKLVQDFKDLKSGKMKTIPGH